MTTRSRQPPMINAPWPVAGFAILLVAAHLILTLLPETLRNFTLYSGALVPERFWATFGEVPASGMTPYGNAFEAFLTLISSAFIHGDWMHVVLNAALLVALAKPLLEVFRAAWPAPGGAASSVLLALFMVSQVAGSLTFLALGFPDGPWSVGASGGISGLLAAVLMLREGPDRWLLSRGFLVASALFVVANAIFAIVGPSLIGAGIAWQSHVGGYLGGAVFMRAALAWMPARRR